jgi:hypothetical protein
MTILTSKIKLPIIYYYFLIALVKHAIETKISAGLAVISRKFTVLDIAILTNY